MIRLVAAALAAVSLSACGGDDVDAPAAAKSTPLTDAQKAVLLASLPAPYNQADLENGRRAFARCRSCHTLTEGGPNMTGPNLWGVFGRQAGSHPRYNYSNALSSAGFAWDAERLDHWLENPRTFLPGNKMSFPGLPNATDRRDLVAFLKVETGYAPPSTPPAS